MWKLLTIFVTSLHVLRFLITSSWYQYVNIIVHEVNCGTCMWVQNARVKIYNIQSCLQLQNSAYMWCLIICGDYRGMIVEKYLATISSII